MTCKEFTFLFLPVEPLNDDEIQIGEQGSPTHESLSETIHEENQSYSPDKYFYYKDYINLVEFSSKSPKNKIGEEFSSNSMRWPASLMDTF